MFTHKAKSSLLLHICSFTACAYATFSFMHLGMALKYQMIKSSAEVLGSPLSPFQILNIFLNCGHQELRVFQLNQTSGDIHGAQPTLLALFITSVFQPIKITLAF